MRCSSSCGCVWPSLLMCCNSETTVCPSELQVHLQSDVCRTQLAFSSLAFGACESDSLPRSHPNHEVALLRLLLRVSDAKLLTSCKICFSRENLPNINCRRLPQTEPQGVLLASRGRS
jgi:hypothetical protein